MSVALLETNDVLKALFGGLLLSIVIIMAAIDAREMILPNRLNALFAASGVGQAVLVGHPQFADAALGAALGFATLSGIAALFRQVRGVEGLGFGDQKFAAAAGIWIGWDQIAPMLLIASCSALAFSITRSLKQGTFDRATRLPFGPFLGLGVVVCWLAIGS
jgi:leader peptidase (prepilin peptidase)/N-methyltransferase